MKLQRRTYPYTYARVSVMRSSLLHKEDYDKIMKMSLNEIISFLQSLEYKRSIDELGVKHSGVELMEMALNKNLTDTWNKLRKISPKEINGLIDTYLLRADLWNIKTILRGLHTKTSPETIASMLMQTGRLTREFESLIKSQSMEEFLKKLEAAGIKFEKLSNAYESLKTQNTIIEIENFLDREHYNRMIELSQSIPSDGKLFKQFLEAEMDTNNIINALRLKKAGTDKHKLPNFVIGKASATVKRIIDTDSKEETIKLLLPYGISEDASKNYLAAGSIAGIETDLGKTLLKKTKLLLHQHPLTIDVILGYMFAKEIEVKNLKLMLKARQLSLSEQFTEKQIIV
ncbi:V-type ATPase subunit [Candidatus Woesearchaeota archaeon]|nr:V-type ATPase subunit [Candidatus Woesearchaeota archaeon]